MPVAGHGWNRWQRLALVGAFVPLVGCAALLAAFCRLPAIEWGLLGLLWVWFGFVCTAAVVVMAVLGWRDAARSRAPFRTRLLPAAAALLVMAANYPAAWGALHLGVWWWSRSTFELVNEATTPWGPLRIVSSDADVSVGTLAAGDSSSVAVAFHADGNAVLLDAASPHPAVDFGYVTIGLPIHARIVRRGDGTLAVSMRGR